jgi:hypothetical protein
LSKILKSYFLCLRTKIPEFNLTVYENVMYEKIFNPKFKGVLHTTYDEMIHAAIRTRGEFPKRIIKDHFMVVMCSMEVERNHKFFEVLDRKTQQMINSGIIEHNRAYFDKFYDPKYYMKPERYTKEYLTKGYRHINPKAPKVLTMEHLSSGFVIWLISFAIAFAAFVTEWFASKCKIKKSPRKQKIQNFTKKQKIIKVQSVNQNEAIDLSTFEQIAGDNFHN